jgi:hypothetical protein
MDRNDAKMMIELLAQMMRDDKELREFFAQEMAKVAGGVVKHNLTLKEAAAKIGKSVSWLYKNQSFFTCEKTGNSKSSTIMFDGLKLVDEYQRLIQSRKKIVHLNFRKAVAQ